MTDRIKLKTAAPRTREEMEQLVGDIAALKIEERRLKAEMDAKLKALKDDYLKQLAGITDSLAPKMGRALAWAEANPEDFDKRRSIEMLHGVIGWRMNTPSLKTLSGWTWERVLEVMGKLPGMFAYIRTKQEVNRQALVADRDQVGTDGFRAIGLRVIQEEEFFVDPKLTEAEKREVAS